MSEERLLVVEDESDQRRLLAELLAAERFSVAEAASLAEARAELARAPVDLVLSDWKLPDGDGGALLAEVRAGHPESAFVMVTAYGTIARAVEAIRAGADDYLAKPFERPALLLAIDRTLERRRLKRENRRLAAEIGERDRLVDLIGRSPAMRRLYDRVERLAPTNATILLTGESGTGKELAARALHQLSRRRDRPFVAVNCAAIPEGLVESEFFGVERGAFTGADRARAGHFEAADGGTLFLDEIGELPLALQPKLLRALQEGRVSRVGASRESVIDVRVVAATNRDLAGEVAAGRFRQDLYYRLNVVPLALPPLRERREDLPLLVEHFTARAARRHGLAAPRFPAAVLRRFLEYAWPGNVRELSNVVERLVLLADDGRVAESDLPPELRGAPGEGSLRRRLPPAADRPALGGARTQRARAGAGARPRQPGARRAPRRPSLQGLPLPAREARPGAARRSAGNRSGFLRSGAARRRAGVFRVAPPLRSSASPGHSAPAATEGAIMQIRTPAVFAAALGLAAFAVFAASAARATGTAKEKPGVHLWLDQQGDELKIDDLGDLAPGESRDYTTASGKKVTVTREAKGYAVDIDGKKIHLGELEASDLAPGARIDRVERIEIGEDGAKQLMIGLGGEDDSVSAGAKGRHTIFLGPDLPPPAGSEIDALVAGLEKSPKFQGLDDATQQLVRDIVREAAPKVRQVHRVEVRRLPGEGGTVLRLEREDGNGDPSDD